MEEAVLKDLRAHAEKEYPREACGVIVVRRGKAKYIACRNNAEQPEQHFILNAEDYANAEDVGTITHIVHSHPNAAPTPSPADLKYCEESGLPWIIVNWPVGTIHEFAPSGYLTPLVGRKYLHGIFDCYTLVRDYYKHALDLDLPDYPRVDEWWLKGEDLYAKHFEECGFVRVTDGSIQVHDAFMMQIGSPVINHAAVYIGDNLILQHCHMRLSSRAPWGGYWERSTVFNVRHRSQFNA